MQKNLLTFLACSLPFSSMPLMATDSATGTTGPITYLELADISLAALNKVAASTIADSATGLLPLSERQKSEIAYQLLARTEQSTHAIKPGHEALRKLLPDLNMFYLDSKDPAYNARHLFSKINRTQTVFGQAALAHMTATPIDNIEQILALQHAIALLLQDQATAQQINSALEQVKSKENSFLANWSPLDLETRRVYDQLLFQNRFLKGFNTNSWALELQGRSEQISPITNTIGMAALIGASTALGATLGATFINPLLDPLIHKHIKPRLPIAFQKYMDLNHAFTSNSGVSFGTYFKASLKSYASLTAYKLNPATYYNFLQGRMGAIAYYMLAMNIPVLAEKLESSINTGQDALLNPTDTALNQYLNNDPFIKIAQTAINPEEIQSGVQQAHKWIHNKENPQVSTIKTTSHIIGAAIALRSAFDTYQTLIKPTQEGIKLVRDTARRESQLHERLSAAATIVNAFNTLTTLIDTCEELKAVLPAYAQAHHSADFKKLMSLLAGSTFKGDTSYVFRSPGAIRAAYALMEKVSNEFSSIVNYIGEVDALLSIAQLMKEHEGQRVGYAFAQFIDQETPYISIDGLWNPMVDEAVVVPNDITLGQDGKARGALVTGSNTGGKSTVMIEGLTTSVLLAHTLGIVPAQSCILTPFAYIGTSLKVHSDIASGMSHLKAEIERAKEIITTIGSLPVGAKAFVAIDELFEGAPGKDGAECLYTTGKRLAALPHALWVIVTQFQDNPTQLECDTDGVCKNFKVDVIKNADGTIERPYKVAAGVSEVNGIAQILLEQALDN